jgi:hypothetical protein
VTPVSVAVHVLEAAVAVKISLPDVLMFWMVEVLVTEPLGPSVPWVLTVIGPELKRTAGPTWTRPDGALAVIGTAEPVAGSVTEGSGPRTLGGPPNRLTLAK